MNRITIPAAVLVLWAGVAAAQQQTAPQQPQQQPPRMAASSYATVEVHVNQRRIGNEWYEEDAGLSGPSRIAISYGQPHARGRQVEGGLIPRDTVWRSGRTWPPRCTPTSTSPSAPCTCRAATTRSSC